MPYDTTYWEEEKITAESLPFSAEKQTAILGFCLKNKSFFLQCKDQIKSAWFQDSVSQMIYANIQGWYTRHGTLPTVEELCDVEDVRAETMNRRNLFRTKVLSCISLVESQTYTLEPLAAEVLDWLRARYFYNGVIEARDLYNRKQLEPAYQKLRDTVQRINDATFGNDITYGFDNIGDLMNQRSANVKNALTWGLELFDRMLLPEGNGAGCLLPKTSTTIVAPVNTGKTVVMITVAVENIKKGKKVLWIPHEGNEVEIRTKFLCCMLNKNLDWLNSNQDLWLKKPEELDEEQQLQLRLLRLHQDKLRRFLTFMPMIRQGLTVETVVSAIRKKYDESAVTDGLGYDLVVDDYPAKLSTEEAKFGKLEHRHKIEAVYMAFNRLAEELGFHMLNAAQTNREGSKINKGYKGYEKRLLGMEDFAEAFGPMADTATVITLNRSPENESQNLLYLHNAKSRTGTKNWTVVAGTNYGNGRSHGEDLGSCGYYGNSIGTFRMVNHINTFRGKMLPKEIDI